MWSLGVIMFTLLAGYPPFFSDDREKLFKMIEKGKFEFLDDYWDTVSVQAQDLIEELLVVDPDLRINSTEALQSQWILNGRKESFNILL